MSTPSHAALLSSASTTMLPTSVTRWAAPMPRGASAGPRRAHASTHDTEQLSSDLSFVQAMRDTATVVRLDSRILLKIVIASPGDASVVEPAQQHLTRNAANVIKLLVDKLDAERLSQRRCELLTALFVEPCRALKTRTVQVVRDTGAAVVDAEYVDVLRQSQAKLAEVADQLVANCELYRERLRQRSENVKSGVLRQAKRVVSSLKELRLAAGGTRPVLDLAARQLSDQVLFFLEIAEAAVLDDEAQLLRSTIADVLGCARRIVGGRAAPSTPAIAGNAAAAAAAAAAAPSSTFSVSTQSTSSTTSTTTTATTTKRGVTSSDELDAALANAGTAIRQVVYGVLASVDDNNAPTSPTKSSTTQRRRKALERRSVASMSVRGLHAVATATATTSTSTSIAANGGGSSGLRQAFASQRTSRGHQSSVSLIGERSRQKFCCCCCC